MNRYLAGINHERATNIGTIRLVSDTQRTQNDSKMKSVTVGQGTRFQGIHTATLNDWWVTDID